MLSLGDPTPSLGGTEGGVGLGGIVSCPSVGFDRALLIFSNDSNNILYDRPYRFFRAVRGKDSGFRILTPISDKDERCPKKRVRIT